MATQVATRDRYAEVSWCFADIQEMRPGWSVKRCNEFLAATERQIQSDMVERGWSSIETLLDIWEEDN